MGSFLPDAVAASHLVLGNWCLAPWQARVAVSSKVLLAAALWAPLCSHVLHILQ